MNGTAKDIMIDIFDFPHVPYWFTIRETMEKLKKVSDGKEKAILSDTILIFDEKYNYMGTIEPKDIVMGLEPTILRKGEWTGPMTEVSFKTSFVSEESLARIAEAMFGEEAKKHAERQVKEIMMVSSVSVSTDDSPAKAAYLMAHYNLPFLPVMEDKQKLVGMISMAAIFNWVSTIVLR